MGGGAGGGAEALRLKCVSDLSANSFTPGNHTFKISSKRYLLKEKVFLFFHHCIIQDTSNRLTLY